MRPIPVAMVLWMMLAVLGMMVVTTVSAQPSDLSVSAMVSATDAGATETIAGKDGGPLLHPDDIKGAVGRAKGAVVAAKEGRWWYFSALILAILMFLLKFIGIKAGFWVKLGRWRYVIVPSLSLAAALLAAFQGEVSVDTAIGVFTSAYAMASLEELWDHGILGKPHS